MKKVTLILISITFISKIFGFLRDVVLSYFYGTSYISDAYLISLTIPITLFSFVAIGISTGYMPMVSKIINEKGSKSSERFTSNIANIIFIVCTIFCFITLLFTKQIVSLFASGFEGKTLDLAIVFTKISIVSVYFTGLIYLFNSYLQLKNDFISPAIIGIPFNVIVVISIIVSFKFNLYILAIGNLFGLAIQFLILLKSAYNKGYRHRFKIDIRDKNLKELIILTIPLILGTSVDQINVLVDRTIASSIAVGGVSALNYATRLNLFVQAIFVASINTVLFPVISKAAAEKNSSLLKNSMLKAINTICLLVIPVTVISMVLSEPIVRFLFGRGAFDITATTMTTKAFFYYSIGMVGFGIRETLARVFYSIQDTKTPMINAAIAMLLNIILNILLSRVLGIGGLALATSTSGIFCAFLLFLSLKKKLGSLGIQTILLPLIKIASASAIMGLITKYVYNFLLAEIDFNFSLIFSIVIGVVIYLIIIYFMKMEDLDDLLTIFKRKFKKV